MAQTEDTYTQQDTTTVLRGFTFPYINQSDIKVSLDGTATTAYAHVGLTQIQFTSAPAVGTAIRIYRETNDSETQATFYPGSAIRAKDLNDNFTQNLYVTQEANNEADSATTIANAATTTANGANTKSDTAISTSNTASGDAATAVNTANVASGNATAAVTTANNASADATTAVNTANAASGNANTATNTANTASTNATAALNNSRESDGSGGFVSAITKANTAISTANTASTNASAAVTTANAAASDASTATSTANTASGNANTAVNTANAASSNASTAVTTANTASTNATTAVNTANSATTTANGAVTTANAATATANTASSNASTALSTANTASSNATTALNTANSATATANSAQNAVAAAVLYDPVTNVSSIPGSPSDGDYIELSDSTGIESFSPLASLPSGFTGDSGLTVRLKYTSSGTTWNYLSYFANDSEDRYLGVYGKHNTTQVSYTVKVVTKTAAHRYHGTGHASGYTIGGIESPFLTLIPGNTYRFDQSDSSNNGHPIAFYKNADKTGAWIPSVTTSGTPGQSGAYTQIEILDTTPTSLSYQCSSHAYMGNGMTTNTGGGGAGATGGGSDEIFVENDQVMTTSYSISANKNASCVGTISLNNGVVLTIPSTSKLLVLN